MVKCPNISAVILTYNEAPNIRYCLESIKDFCEIFVLDSFSTDTTVSICREYTDHIFQNDYENHSIQWQWALNNLPLKTDWVLALDADFTVSDALKSRIHSELPDIPVEIDGIYVRHLYCFGGGPIRFGGTKQSWLRIIRKGAANPDLSDLVDFRFVVKGETLTWREAVIEYNRHDDDISTWLTKQDKFSLRLAVEEELRRNGRQDWTIKPSLTGTTDQRFARLRDLWMRSPLFVRPVMYFIYRYFLALGFLDGRAGFLYAALQGFWLRLVVDWKTIQLRKLGLKEEELVSFARHMLKYRDGSVDRLNASWRSFEKDESDAA